MKPNIELPGWCLILQKLTEEIERENTAKEEINKPSEKNAD
jgi:hypothetical protein